MSINIIMLILKHIFVWFLCCYWIVLYWIVLPVNLNYILCNSEVAGIYINIYGVFQFTQHLRGVGKTERCCSPGRRRRRRRRYYWLRERWEETGGGLSGQPEPPRGKPQPSSQNIQSDLWREQRKWNYYSNRCMSILSHL